MPELSFEPIGLEKQGEYKTRLTWCDSISSDYSFVNLWSWADERGLHIKSYWDGEDSVAVFQPKPYHISIPGYVYC